MKKIALTMAAAAIVLASAPAHVQAADATANASVQVISAITVAKTADLTFGTISTAGAGGTVAIANTADTATSGGADITVVGASASRAKFTISGEANQSYTLTVDSTASLTDQGGNGGSAMSVALDPSLTNGTQTISSGGSDTLNVGGTLTVGASQASSNYSGTFNVTVVYN